MESINKLITLAVEKRVATGSLFKPEDTRQRKCGTCDQTLNIVGAIIWGKPVDGYLQYQEHDHTKPIEPLPTQVSTNVHTIADFVVIVSGKPCFISKDEKEQLICVFQGGGKAAKVRDYFFDKPYAIVPFDEWQAEEERKGRFIDAVTI